jgi:hypothetical protein
MSKAIKKIEKKSTLETRGYMVAMIMELKRLNPKRSLADCAKEAKEAISLL